MTLPVDLLQWIEPGLIEPPDWALEIAGGQRLIAQTLIRRGLSSRQEAMAFLYPSAYIPADAFDLPDMERAVLRIERALAQRERIGVWGDFDVDGQSATALLVSALRRLNADVVYYIPVRAQESHGIQLASLQTFLRHGIQLLLTCDTGITAHESIGYAQNMGVDVIVTDHHALPEALPSAYAVVNSQRVNPQHPLYTLCGVGAAFKLVEALFIRAGLSSELGQYTDLVALGSVADLALLRGETRYLVQRGLEQMRAAIRPAFHAMLAQANVEGNYLSAAHIGFVLGPRLNAVGRLEDANPMVDFLTSSDPSLVNVTAARLEGLNSRRKLLTDQVFQAARAEVERNQALLREPSLVLTHPKWPAGVIGIVANRLVELYHRPVILFSAPEGQLARGSARSMEGINITEAIAACSDLVAGFGGHRMAAGLGVRSENLAAFQRQFNRAILSQTSGEPVFRQLMVDAFLELPEIDLPLVEALEQLAPFGAGNPPLTFATRNLRIASETTVGRTGEHVQMIVEAPDGATRRVIWWQGGGSPRPEGAFDLAYTLSASNYRGQPQVQMEWLHARPVERLKPVEIQSPGKTYQIEDLREAIDPELALKDILQQREVAVWAEGGEAKGKGSSRQQLHLAAEFVIFTSPPGPAELAAALAIVRPEKVTLLASPPIDDTPEAFLRRLAGLATFAIHRREGRTDLPSLAAATGQRETTVRAGLDWLAARGDITCQFSGANQVQIASGGEADTAAGLAAMRRVVILLDETVAYRAYYRRADANWLLSHAAPDASKSRR